MQKLVSIIVPVYNVEKYIDKCVRSLLKQDYGNIEVILVDDGSPDKSGYIIDRLKEEDNRIVVIHQENHGVSSARNAGMAVASGEYITFVDGDDWVDQDNLYTVDLICHGSPSPELLKMYLKEKSVDIEELEGLNFREKTSFGLRLVGENNGFPRIVDMYTYAFLKSIDYTENCYSCRYASQSRVSDISLGDSWGSELSEEEKKKGISLVLCQTKKGEELLKKSNVELFDADITRAIQLNHQLEYPSRIPSSRMFFFENLEKGFDFAMKKILPKEYLKNEIKIILSKVGIRR